MNEAWVWRPGVLPRGWRWRSIAELHTGEVSSLDPRDFLDEPLLHFSIPAYQDGEMPNVAKGKDILSTKLKIPQHCVLFGKLNPRVQKVWNVHSSSSLRHVASTEWLPIVPTEGVDQEFLYFLMWSNWVMPLAQRLVTGSTPSRQRVNPEAFYSIDVAIPPLEQQQAIGAALGQVRDAIKVQAQAATVVQELKRAAMQTLFTRGLRGEPQKETEIGPVPESWKLSNLGTLCATTDSVDLRSEGERVIEYVDVSSISREYLCIETTSRFVLKEAPGRARKRILTGDVLFATVRPTLLRAAPVPEELENQVCSTAFCVLRRDPKGVALNFIYYLVQCEQFIRQLAGIETGASYPAATDRMVKEQLVPIPPIDEQSEIVAILDAIDRKIDLRRRKRATLEELFKALLHKLMTGEVRVGELDLESVSGYSFEWKTTNAE